LMRKGRMDEIFFVDLPRSRERAEIFSIHLRKMKRDVDKFDLRALVKAAAAFSGAEIEQAIISGMHESFFENREVTTEDILQAMSQTIPLSHTMREQIVALRSWAAERSRPVTFPGVRRKPRIASGAGVD